MCCFGVCLFVFFFFIFSLLLFPCIYACGACVSSLRTALGTLRRVGDITGLLKKACPAGMGPSPPPPAVVACSSPCPGHVQPFQGEGNPLVSSADGRGGRVVLLSSWILRGHSQAGQPSWWHVAVTLDSQRL